MRYFNYKKDNFLKNNFIANPNTRGHTAGLKSN